MEGDKIESQRVKKQRGGAGGRVADEGREGKTPDKT